MSARWGSGLAASLVGIAWHGGSGDVRFREFSASANATLAATIVVWGGATSRQLPGAQGADDRRAPRLDFMKFYPDVPAKRHATVLGDIAVVCRLGPLRLRSG